MTVHDTEAMERELLVREHVRETIARVDAMPPYIPPERPWKLPEKPAPVARASEPARPVTAAVGGPVAVRAPAPAGSRVWALCAFAPGEEPTWRWLSLADSVLEQAVARAFGDFTASARREFDERRGTDEASRHNFVLRLQAAEQRIADLEAKLAAPKAKR